MGREKEIVARIIENMAKGNETRHKWVFNREDKKLFPQSKDHDPDDHLVITPQDATLYSTNRGHSATILISGEIVEKMVRVEGERDFFLSAGMTEKSSTY